MKINTLLLPSIALVACLQSAALIGMEAAPTERQKTQLIRRSASQEAIHSEEYAKLKMQQTFDAQMAKAERIHAELNATLAMPAAPVYKPRAKPAAAPAPEKPQSFYARNKKVIWGVGIGAGTLATAGIILNLTQTQKVPRWRQLEG